MTSLLSIELALQVQRGGRGGLLIIGGCAPEGLQWPLAVGAEVTCHLGADGGKNQGVACKFITAGGSEEG